MSTYFAFSRNRFVSWCAVLASIAVFGCSVNEVNGQSSSKSTTRSPRVAAKKPALALEGNCPVCILTAQKWVKGNEQIAAEYDGKTYLFPGEEQKKMFLTDPAKFVPALGGDCIVCYVQGGKRPAGKIEHYSLYKDRLFLFPSEAEKAEFDAQPTKYANGDLAYHGNCAVCFGSMKKEVPGKSEFTVVHHGLRYLFPSAKERQVFLAEPDKFAEQLNGEGHSSENATGK